MRDIEAVGRICIVANELPRLFRNGGIGTHNWLLAETLRSAGWSVHVLYCGDVEDPSQLLRCRQLWDAKGIALWHIDEFLSPTEDSVQCDVSGSLDKHSMHVRRALEQLDASHHFDLIEFAEWTGYGFRTIQAHKMGSAFPDTRVVVKLHSSSQWCREGNRTWLDGTDDLIRDYFERYSFEHADYQLSPSQYMLDYAGSIGWKVRPDVRVVPYCYPASAPTLTRPDAGIPELVFFGRLELRKGLKIFLEMARSLPRDVAVTFLGKEVAVDGLPAGKLIKRMLGRRPFTLLTQLDRDQALDYLRQSHRLAIMPSLIENYPFTVLECAANGIPFLAANVGGIPEIVADHGLQEALLFDPTPHALRDKIDQYADADPKTRHRYVRQMHEICNSSMNHALVCRAYSKLLPPRSADVTAAQLQHQQPILGITGEQPLVTIVVPYFNLGVLLPETLASIAAQDYSPLQVIVVNDGSTDEYALQVWEEMKLKYPQFCFVTQSNQGLGAVRNTGLELAAGEYFLPIDADNVGRTDMVSRFVQGLKDNPDVAVATCFFLAFEDTADIREGRFPYAYRPCGGPYVAAALRNVYGDANAMSRTAALRAVGGYETEKHTTCEDWEMYVKLARHGYGIDVVPDYLFYYRHRPTSLLRTTDAYLNRRRVLRQFFSTDALPAAEQMQLWTALASFDNRQRELQLAQHPTSAVTLTSGQNAIPCDMYGVSDKTTNNRTGLRLAMYKFKWAVRRRTYYHVLFDKLKRKHAA